MIEPIPPNEGREAVLVRKINELVDSFNNLLEVVDAQTKLIDMLKEDMSREDRLHLYPTD